MDNSGLIDVTFDFQSDTPQGKDPDALSRTLRQCHKLLWSKPLPSGAMFELVDTTPGIYLHHRSQLGEFVKIYQRAYDQERVRNDLPPTELLKRFGLTES